MVSLNYSGGGRVYLTYLQAWKLLVNQPLQIPANAARYEWGRAGLFNLSASLKVVGEPAPTDPPQMLQDMSFIDDDREMLRDRAA